ncbi:MAG: AAC(3) family N-acetyltransferase [Bacillota bacterium]|nr:AAC(3) family N-acetyltransferase [Bacillota bacterium]
MELEVHSSLKSFGYVDGGAETVISALKCAVGTNGSIFMPALRMSPDLPLTEEDKKNGVLRKIKVLSPEERKSGMGIIADTFRLLPDTEVGEGTFAISAWGKNADKVSTGLGYLIDNGGKALLLGVDIYSLTAMHYVEKNMPKEISDMFKSPHMDAIYPPEEWFIENGAPLFTHGIQSRTSLMKLV